MAVEFTPWPKIARLNRDIVVTEKIDGTNAAVVIYTDPATGDLRAAAQSRTRLITPKDDNYGFARWVQENADTLIRDLGEGVHFGEWWGAGIQRGYCGHERTFSLFNTHRWEGANLLATTPNLSVVPVLYKGPFRLTTIDIILSSLAKYGSVVQYGAEAEGVVIYHTHARTMFKVTLKDDAIPKSEAAVKPSFLKAVA